MSQIWLDEQRYQAKVSARSRRLPTTALPATGVPQTSQRARCQRRDHPGHRRLRCTGTEVPDRGATVIARCPTEVPQTSPGCRPWCHDGTRSAHGVRQVEPLTRAKTGWHRPRQWETAWHGRGRGAAAQPSTTQWMLPPRRSTVNGNEGRFRSGGSGLAVHEGSRCRESAFGKVGSVPEA